MTEAEFAGQVELGRTGLKIGRLGLASGYGIGPEGIELALAKGQNFFCWGSPRKKKFGEELARQVRIERTRLVIAIQSYSRSAWLMERSVESALRRLGTDFLDLLILGFWQNPLPVRIVEAARKLRQLGRVRFLGVSTHSLGFARFLADREWVDALMLRYNVAHREAEGLFDSLSAPSRPGIIAFTATRWGHLLDPRRMPAGEQALQASDCYRFCLSHPQVDMVLCGPANADEWRAGLKAIESARVKEEEMDRMLRIGNHVRHKGVFFYDFGSRD